MKIYRLSTLECLDALALNLESKIVTIYEDFWTQNITDEEPSHSYFITKTCLTDPSPNDMLYLSLLNIKYQLLFEISNSELLRFDLHTVLDILNWNNKSNRITLKYKGSY